MHTLDDDPKAIRADYKAHGYRSLLSEEFFVHDSGSVPSIRSAPPVRRVTTIDVSDRIKRERRNKKAIRDVDLDCDEPEHRLYAVMRGRQAMGWVGSVPFGNASWIADLYVLPEFRGKGYGSALMSEVTLDDRRLGVYSSVLLASAAGARLYPHIGYRHIGTLQLFCPKRAA
jgi:GNAT superfamily N-acetyltransferase